MEATMVKNELQPSNEQPQNKKTAEQTSIAAEAYDWAESIVFALAIVVTIFTFIVRPVGVVGESMMNTLQNGDKVVICNLNYTPKQGDIVVLSTKAVTTPIIKRVIAVGGQTVKIDYDTNKVYVDGKEYDAPIKEEMLPEGDTTFPLKVQPGHVFVMGDNRNDSLDSRFSQIGQVDVKDIIGHAVFRIMPFNSFGTLK
jgi:signal peptidase I